MYFFKRKTNKDRIIIRHTIINRDVVLSVAQMNEARKFLLSLGSDFAFW